MGNPLKYAKYRYNQWGVRNLVASNVELWVKQKKTNI